MINNSDMIQVLLEHLAKQSEPFLLIINKRTVEYHNKTKFNTSDQEVFYSDKDEAVARLFELCELYRWELTRVDVYYDYRPTFIVKYWITLERNEVMQHENNKTEI